MDHEQLRQRAIKFLFEEFDKRVAPVYAPVHLVQAAVAIILSDKPITTTEASE